MVKLGSKINKRQVLSMARKNLTSTQAAIMSANRAALSQYNAWLVKAEKGSVNILTLPNNSQFNTTTISLCSKHLSHHGFPTLVQTSGGGGFIHVRVS